MGYLIFGTIGLACLVLYCLCACLNSALSDGDDWEMDHINGLSTEMNLYWINIPLPIAFSLNVLYLIWVFISSNLALLSRFTSGQSDQLSVYKLYTWFPLRLFLFLRTDPPSPPPSISNQFSMVRTLYSIIDYLYPLHSAVNHVILPKSSKTPSLPSPGD